MFPLSEEESVQLAYIDTADYPEIERALKADEKMPRLILIANQGKEFYVYEGDAEDLPEIQGFIRNNYKKQTAHKIPKRSELINYADFSKYAMGAIKLVSTRVPQELMIQMGLEKHHLGIQIAAIASFIGI